jgi:hypothetical protein
VFEFDAFAHGTETIARAIAASSAFSIAGGGDTLAAIAKYGIEKDVGYISTGGGAFLEGARRQDAAGLRDPREAGRGIRVMPVATAGTPIIRRHNTSHTGDLSMSRATKIVAELRPGVGSPRGARAADPQRASMWSCGSTFSHGTGAGTTSTRDAGARHRAARRKEVAIMATCRPKIRVGKFEGGKVLLHARSGLHLDAGLTELGNAERRRLDYKGTAARRSRRHAAAQRRADPLTSTRCVAEKVHTRVVVGGDLSNNKGINKAGGG